MLYRLKNGDAIKLEYVNGVTMYQYECKFYLTVNTSVGDQHFKHSVKFDTLEAARAYRDELIDAANAAQAAGACQAMGEDVKP